MEYFFLIFKSKPTGRSSQNGSSAVTQAGKWRSEKVDRGITLRRKNHPWPHWGQSQEFAQLNRNPIPAILILPNPASRVLYEVFQQVSQALLALVGSRVERGHRAKLTSSLSKSLRAMRRIWGLTRQPWPRNINNQAAEAETGNHFFYSEGSADSELRVTQTKAAFASHGSRLPLESAADGWLFAKTCGYAHAAFTCVMLLVFATNKRIPWHESITGAQLMCIKHVRIHFVTLYLNLIICAPYGVIWHIKIRSTLKWAADFISRKFSCYNRLSGPLKPVSYL